MRKIGFVLLSPAAAPLPSTRVSVLNMLPHLVESGFATTILHDPVAAGETPDVTDVVERARAEGCDVVYFQKVRGPSVHRALRDLAQAGIRTAYGVCDVVDPEMVAAADLTIVVTEFLKQLHPQPLWHKIRVVHDGIERPGVARTQWDNEPATARRPLRCVLVTSASLTALPVLRTIPRWMEVVIVGRYPADAQARARATHYALSEARGLAAKWRYLRFRIHPRITLVPWDPEGVYDELLAADVGIVPVDRTGSADGSPPAWQVKSENRLTMKMAAALPVIATPIPAYRPIVQHGRNAFFAEDEATWLSALESLRAPDARMRIGLAARAAVIDAYSQATQARRLVAALSELSLPRTAAFS